MHTYLRLPQVIELFQHNLPAAEASRLSARLHWRRPDIPALCTALHELVGWAPTHSETVLLPLSTAVYFQVPKPELIGPFERMVSVFH